MIWPWVEGDTWDNGGQLYWHSGETRPRRQVRWRPIGVNIFYFEQGEPTSGDVIRVRYRKNHFIQNLDSAASTTISDLHEYILVLRAAAWLIEQRLRQITENPAIPKEAAAGLQKLYASWMNEYMSRLGLARHSQNPSWSRIGL
jgi:hypothetical protein